MEALLREALAPLERALAEHHAGGGDASLTLRFDDGSLDEVPVSWFFRGGDQLDAVDRAALELSGGRVLDVGAGAGVHALPLQRRGHAVTALEILPEAARILRARGVRDVRVESVWAHGKEDRYETVLLLMNGTGLAGTLPRLPPLLRHVATLVSDEGAVLIDSTDPGEEGPGDGRSPGERQIQLEYRGLRGPPFPHLYVSAPTLAAAAREAGMSAEVVLEIPDEGRFLAACRRVTT